MLLACATTARVESSQYGRGGYYSQQFLNSNLEELEDLIFDSCPDCSNIKSRRMSSIPHGAFVAHKVQANMDKHQTWDIAVTKIHGYEKSCPNQKFQVNKMNLDHPLAKYNGKLMKSIWGMYNRYSVHNLKSFTEGENVMVTGAQHNIHADAPASSSFNSKGGLKNGPKSNPTWEALRNSCTY